MRADPTEHFRGLLRSLAPGESLTIDRDCLADDVMFANPEWTPAEWLLEGIIGSSYEYSISYTHDRHPVLKRLETICTGNLRSYVSPDRRHHYTQRPDGLYEPKPTAE